MGFRDWSVGSDTIDNALIFESITYSNLISDYRYIAGGSLGYYFFVKLCSFLHANYQSFLLILSLLYNFGIRHFIMKLKLDVCFAYYLYLSFTYMYFAMNTARQALAFMILINAFYYLYLNIKSSTGWLLFLLSISIHITSLFGLIGIIGIILSNKIKNKFKVFIYVSFVSFILTLSFNKLVSIVALIMPHYNLYLEEGGLNINVASGAGRIVFLYFFLFIILLFWLRLSYIETHLSSFNGCLFPALIFITIFGILNSENTLINRLIWYYVFLYIPIIEEIRIKLSRNVRLVFLFIIVNVLGVYHFLNLLENKGMVVPYKFFF